MPLHARVHCVWASRTHLSEAVVRQRLVECRRRRPVSVVDMGRVVRPHEFGFRPAGSLP